MKRFAPILIVALLVLVGVVSLSAVQAATPPANDPTATFLTGPSSDDAEVIARRYIRENSAALGLSAADADGWVVSDRSTSRQNGVTFIYLQQAAGGIRVHNAIVNFGIMPDGRILHVGNRGVNDLHASLNTTTPSLSAADAIARGAVALGLTPTSAFTRLELRGGAAQEAVYSDGGVSQRAIPVKLMYFPIADGDVRLVWDFSIDELSGLHRWSARVDAVTGELLDCADWTVNENTDIQVGESIAIDPATIANTTDANPAVTGADDSNPDSYRVFALPAESPIHTTPPFPADGRTLAVNPANAAASPFGWHDTDGAAGAEYTVTRGNNVNAGLDLTPPNGNDAGSQPDGGAGLNFDFPVDFTQDPTTYQPAVVTNLFYWNNAYHDIVYQYGFDEASGNFQENNYGNGGAGSDEVNAEGQDYSGTNNANFSTPADGANPRMQMYIWTPPLTVTVEVLTPASIAGIYYASKANFGPDITSEGVTGTVAIAVDGVGADPNDACEVITNPAEIAGKIALINRGNCNFDAKVQRAETAGAIAVLIVNNVDTRPNTMGGSAAVTITAAHIYRSLGISMTNEIGNNVTVNIRDDGLQIPNRDSDLDTGVIIHEYTHGVSNRLTGGPAAASCLSNQEQGGEGWSDWYGMAVTADANDTSVQPRGVGTYVNYDEVDGQGIRPAPYSLDLSVNPYTYANMSDSNISIPHGIGFIWASNLWDVYWNLRTDLGYDANIYSGTGGNNLALQIVTDGLKLQPCRPGFVDARNAVIAAATANGLSNDQVCRLVWSAFARRGLGASASQGLNTVVGDETAAYDMPTNCVVTAVTLGGLNVAGGNVALPVAAITLVALMGAAMVWRHRRAS